MFQHECPVCGHKRSMPKTNADRIRSMTDEELAMIFAEHERFVAKTIFEKFGIPFQEYDLDAAKGEFLGRLQQPAEE